MNKKALKHLVKTDNWKEVKLFFEEKAEELISLDKIPSSLTDKQIALQVKANKKASEIIKETLKSLEKIGIDFNKDNESYI